VDHHQHDDDERDEEDREEEPELPPKFSFDLRGALPDFSTIIGPHLVRQ